jgi:hypothetical protein
MTTNISTTSSAFRIRRSNGATIGFANQVDPLVKMHLDELNLLLGLPVFPIDVGATVKAKAVVESSDEVARLLSLPLTPKKTPKERNAPSAWANDSLAAFMAARIKKPAKYSISDHIDQTAQLAQLKYAFLDAMQDNWSAFGYNARAVLEHYSCITDFLTAYAYHLMNVRDVATLKHFMLNNKSGAHSVLGYVAVSAARSLIDAEQLKVDDYNEDDSPFVARLLKAPLTLSTSAFSPAIRAQIEEFVFDRDEEDIIDHANIGVLPEGIKPLLVKYMQQSPVPITASNAHLFLPNFILQIMRVKGVSDPTAGDLAPAADEFEVQFEDDSDSSLEINRSAVRCAAQLYHTMVLGEELDVFGAVAYLTQQRLVRNGGLRIESKLLRADIKSYVLSNKFIDLKTGQLDDRTRPAERQMFQRQVFDHGDAQVPSDLFMNDEFKQLWKVLMLESARYLQSAQASVNPESFVSRQNVMQAVEDLQYNLSSRCTGMATLMAPVADAELNFVLNRILKHGEIIKQVVPEGGTWKQVLDKLNAEQHKSPGSAATLYNKARLGQGIINAIADYTPAAFEDDRIFSDFISKVDAFITTQSILQRPKHGGMRHRQANNDDAHHPDESAPMPDESHAEPAPGAPATPAGGEWDF